MDKKALRAVLAQAALAITKAVEILEGKSSGGTGGSETGAEDLPLAGGGLSGVDLERIAGIRDSLGVTARDKVADQNIACDSGC